MEILDKVEKKYGHIGGTVFIGCAIFGAFVVLYFWAIATLAFIWPASIPPAIAAYMAWSARDES